MIELAPNLREQERVEVLRLAFETLKPLCWKDANWVEEFEISFLMAMRRLSRLLTDNPTLARQVLGEETFAAPQIPPTQDEVDCQVKALAQKGADFRSVRYHEAIGALIFFRTHLSEVIAAGKFGAEQVTAIVEGADASYGRFALKFLEENLASLMSCRLLSRDHIKGIMKALKGLWGSPELRDAFCKAMSTHLEALIEAGLFDREHVTELQGSFRNDYDFLGQTLATLIKKGVFDQEHLMSAIQDGTFDAARFLEKNLGTLLETGLYDQQIHALLARNLQRIETNIDSSTIAGAAVRIFNVWFDKLLEYGFFTQADYRSILRLLDRGEKSTHHEGKYSRERIDVLYFLERHFPSLLAQGWVDIERDLAAVRAKLAHNDWFQAHDALHFYDTQLPTLIASDLFTKADYAALKRKLFGQHSGVARALFTAHFPLLLEGGFFDEASDLPLLACSFADGHRDPNKSNEVIVNDGLKFLGEHLHLLLERGLFKRHHVGVLVKAASSGEKDSADARAADEFLATHFSTLAAHGLIQPHEAAEAQAETSIQAWVKKHRDRFGYDVSNNAFYHPDDFAAKFHGLQAQGFMDAFTFGTLLGHAHAYYAAVRCFVPLSSSKGWMDSPAGWTALARFLGTLSYQERNAGAVFGPLTKLLQRSEEHMPANIALLLVLSVEGELGFPHSPLLEGDDLASRLMLILFKLTRNAQSDTLRDVERIVTRNLHLMEALYALYQPPELSPIVQATQDIPMGDAATVGRLRALAIEIARTVDGNEQSPFRDQIHNHPSPNNIRLVRDRLQAVRSDEKFRDHPVIEQLEETLKIAEQIYGGRINLREFHNPLSEPLRTRLAFPASDTPSLQELSQLAISLRRIWNDQVGKGGNLLAAHTLTLV
ncbi:MAG: hypothetical protein WC840_04795, partial [Candidatus Peribacteraceae bacterium]